MFLGLLQLALCVVVVCEVSDVIETYPLLVTDFCKLTEHDAQLCRCRIKLGFLWCENYLVCSDADQINATKQCKQLGFADGHCKNDWIPSVMATIPCKFYECPTTRGEIMNDFRGSKIKDLHRLKCYCDDDYKNSSNVLTEYAKSIHQLQIAAAKKECPTKLSVNKKP